MRLAWATDLHLDMLTSAEVVQFARSVLPCDAFVLTGDVSVASHVVCHLDLLAKTAKPPLFVLGNHDFYGGAITSVREEMRALPPAIGQWLPGLAPHRLADEWVCTGVDGFGDARAGNVDGSEVRLSDFNRIDDLKGLDRSALHGRLRELGEAEAQLATDKLTRAAGVASNILFLTHVPPFSEAVLYKEQPGDPDWLPYFTGVGVGEALLRFVDQHTNHHVLVLSGHTHHEALIRPRPNLEVRVGAAQYGRPSVNHLTLNAAPSVPSRGSSLS